MIINMEQTRVQQKRGDLGRIDKDPSQQGVVKSLRTNNQALMEKLFHNFREMQEGESERESEGRDRSELADNTTSKVYSDRATMKLTDQSRSFGQNISMNHNLPSISSQPRLTTVNGGFGQRRKDGNGKNLTSRENGYFDGTFDDVSGRERVVSSVCEKTRERRADQENGHSKNRKTGDRQTDLSKKSQSIFYNSGGDSSLEQFEKMEEEAEGGMETYAVEENEDEEEYSGGEEDQGIDKSLIDQIQNRGGEYDASEDDMQDYEDNKRLTIFGDQHSESGEDGEYDEDDQNRTIKEISERREESGVYISSEDKKALLKRLKENFENNNAFDCIEFDINDSQANFVADDSFDIDDRRVLFESEVRKQIQRNEPFDQTEECGKLELLRKLSKNSKGSPKASTSKFAGFMNVGQQNQNNRHQEAQVQNKSINLQVPSQSKIDLSDIVNYQSLNNPNNSIEPSEESFLGKLIKNSQDNGDSRMMDRNKDSRMTSMIIDYLSEGDDGKNSQMALHPKSGISLRTDNNSSKIVHQSVSKSSKRDVHNVLNKSGQRDSQNGTISRKGSNNGKKGAKFEASKDKKRNIHDDSNNKHNKSNRNDISNISQSQNKSLNKTSMRSLGDQQMEALKNMFFDSDKCKVDTIHNNDDNLDDYDNMGLSEKGEDNSYESVGNLLQMNMGLEEREKSHPKKSIILERLSSLRRSSENTDQKEKSSFNSKAFKESRIENGQVSLSLIHPEEQNESEVQKSPEIQQKIRHAPKIPPRGILSVHCTSHDSNSMMVEELTNYYLDQSHSKRVSMNRGGVTSKRVENQKSGTQMLKNHISELGDWNLNQNSDEMMYDSGFFSGECPIAFPSNTNTNTVDGQKYMLENLTEVLRSDFKEAGKKVAVVNAKEVEEMQRMIRRLEKENMMLRNGATLDSKDYFESREDSPKKRKNSMKEGMRSSFAGSSLQVFEIGGTNQGQTIYTEQVESKLSKKNHRAPLKSISKNKKVLERESRVNSRSISRPRQDSRERSRTPLHTKSIKTFKDLVEYLPTNSYSQIHAKKNSNTRSKQ